MYRFDTLTRSLALLAIVAIAIFTSIASANDGGSEPASDTPSIADRYGPVAATSVPFSYISAPRRAPAVAATSVPFSYISAPAPVTSLVYQTDSYWFDAAIRFTTDSAPTAVSDDTGFDLANRYAEAGGAPAVTTALIYQTDRYWFDVAMRYADASDPFRPQIAAER